MTSLMAGEASVRIEFQMEIEWDWKLLKYLRYTDIGKRRKKNIEKGSNTCVIPPCIRDSVSFLVVREAMHVEIVSAMHTIPTPIRYEISALSGGP